MRSPISIREFLRVVIGVEIILIIVALFAVGAFNTQPVAKDQPNVTCSTWSVLSNNNIQVHDWLCLPDSKADFSRYVTYECRPEHIGIVYTDGNLRLLARLSECKLVAVGWW